VSKNIESAIERLYKVNLAVKKNERVLVFTDRIREDEQMCRNTWEKRLALSQIAQAVANTGGKIGKVIFVQYDATSSSGSEPPLILWKAAFGPDVIRRLEDKNLLSKLMRKESSEQEIRIAYNIAIEGKGVIDVVIALSWFSTSHTKFRELLTKVGTRYASLPRFDLEMFYGPMDVDWGKIKRRTTALKGKMSRAVTATVQSPNGTSLGFSLANREAHADTGILIQKGDFGNLPAGEAYIAPIEGTAEGNLVIDWAPDCKLREPVIAKVRRGMVTSVEGESEFVERLEKRFKEEPLTRNIAEFGIGTNDKANRPDSILEAEKILGTVHIALGDNSTFGGRVQASFHEDYVVFEPTVKFEYRDGTLEFVLESGKLR
jgi:aminopeptidase